MEATRRQSVSELNLEEILLAMADSDTPQQITSHSSVKPRPLPTPQVRPRAQTGPPLPEHSVHYPTNEYHSPYPVDPAHSLPPGDDPYYTSGYPEQPQQAMYQYEAANYMYQQDPSLPNMYQQDPSQPDMYQQDPSQPNMYYGGEQEYSYGEGYPYLPEQGYGEYYQEYGYPYYVPEQPPAGYPEYYYPYEYPNQDYPPQDYPYVQQQQQYYAEIQPVVSGYEAATATASNFSTTRRPLPRLPPKKQRQGPTPGHDLTFGTPSIDSSHHLGLHQRKEVDTASHVQPQPQPTIHPQVQPHTQPYIQQQTQIQPPIQHQTQVPIQPPVQVQPQPPPKPVERHTTHLPPPPQKVPEPLSKEEEVDSPENLAAIMADISLQFSERAQPPSKSSASQAQSFRDHESSRTSRSQSYRENDSHYPSYSQDHSSNRLPRSQSFKEDDSHYTSHPPSFQEGRHPPSQTQSFREVSNQYPSHSQSFREEDHPPTRGQTLNQSKFHSAPESLDTPQATTAPPIPGSPAPPPRLSKQAAALRLSNGSSYASSPSLGTPSRDSRTQSVSTHSNLSHATQAHGSSKPAAKVVANARGFKKGPSRLTSSKPQNAVQLLGLSKPVTDSDADGFDFDETDFEPVDRAVLAMSIPPDCSLEQLVREHLTPNLRADWARIRAIFIWIVENIRYDSQLVPVVRGPSPNVNMVSSSDGSDDDEGSNSTPSVASDDELGGDEYLETPKAVLHRRACRQHGFANLFRAMCASAGLECEIVTGYLKDPNDLSELNKIPEANHSWICVKIQGYYRFIDCGLSVSSHPCNVHKKTDLFYFLTNPSKLIYTHFPTNKGHQYLRPAIPFSSFALLPFATDVYFDYGIRFLDLPEGILTIHEDQTGEINLSIPEDMKCWGEVEVPDPAGRGVRRLPALVQCRTKEDGRVAKVMIRIKGKCNSALLRFRCGYPQDGKILSYCFSLRLAHTGSKAPEEFVKILPSPVEFFLIVPLNFDLLYNIAYRFHVLPGAVESRHFKLALRSPSMKIHKFVYYPGDQGYIANVTLRERGQWAISYMVRSKEERPSKREPWINVACYRCI